MGAPLAQLGSTWPKGGITCPGRGPGRMFFAAPWSWVITMYSRGGYVLSLILAITSFTLLDSIILILSLSLTKLWMTAAKAKYSNILYSTFGSRHWILYLYVRLMEFNGMIKTTVLKFCEQKNVLQNKRNGWNIDKISLLFSSK